MYHTLYVETVLVEGHAAVRFALLDMFIFP